MSKKKGRILDVDVGERLKTALMDVLNDEEIVALRMEVDVEVKSGYTDKAWYAWKNPACTQSVSSKGI
ncbi:MAG: hypothetical protein F4Y38_02525 [Gemmatimonadetes bacterium]|nr:hypothetical protein [Gemmatimonadota bacterium]MYG84161.1 hypothetical protein [Gemmatimonadota bacterium]MYJ89382.1 hypothetical protein [Gemmatimonadota bacterium]